MVFFFSLIIPGFMSSGATAGLFSLEELAVPVGFFFAVSLLPFREGFWPAAFVVFLAAGFAGFLVAIFAFFPAPVFTIFLPAALPFLPPPPVGAFFFFWFFFSHYIPYLDTPVSCLLPI